MKNDELRRLPPPPLFTIRPPPKPPGSLFEHFQTAEILNGQCIRPSLNLHLTSSSTIIEKHPHSTNWLHTFLLILSIITVISCIIIAIFIFICLKKLRKEEKEYKTYFMTGSISSRNHSHSHPHQRHYHSDLCRRTSEHYRCPSTNFNCCEDYYCHQLIPLNEVQSQVNPTGTNENCQNHQYECIPEYFLTMGRHQGSFICQRPQQIPSDQSNSCSAPYATFSRSFILSRETATTASTSESSQCTCSPPSSSTTATTTTTAAAIPQPEEESSIPLLTSMSSPKLTIVQSQQTNHSNYQKRLNFLSQLRKSSLIP